MGETLIEIIILLGDSIGVAGGLLAVYQVANGPDQWALSLAGGLLLLAAAVGLFYASTQRNYEARRWMTVTLAPGAALPGSAQAARSLQKRAKWSLRAAASLFGVAAVFTLTVVILAAYESNRDVEAEAFKSLAIVAVSIYTITAAQIMVELVLVYKAVGLELSGLPAKIGYSLPPFFEILGTLLLMVVFVQDVKAEATSLDDIGVFVGGGGVALGIMAFVYRAFIAPRWQRRGARRVAPADDQDRAGGEPAASGRVDRGQPPSASSDLGEVEIVEPEDDTGNNGGRPPGGQLPRSAWTERDEQS